MNVEGRFRFASALTYDVWTWTKSVYSSPTTKETFAVGFYESINNIYRPMSVITN